MIGLKGYRESSIVLDCPVTVMMMNLNINSIIIVTEHTLVITGSLYQKVNLALQKGLKIIELV
jgi:hypothetical protein